MPNFTLTKEYLDSIVEALEKNDMGPLVGTLDPEVHWEIGGPEEDPKGTQTGTFVGGPRARRGLEAVVYEI